jgi:hypothetical protein
MPGESENYHIIRSAESTVRDLISKLFLRVSTIRSPEILAGRCGCVLVWTSAREQSFELFLPMDTTYTK